MSSEHESSGISADVPRPPSAPPPASPVVSALSAALSACALSLPLSLAYQCLSLVLRLRKSSSSSNSARVQGRRDSRREALVLGTLSQANQHALQLAASLAVFQAAYRFLLQCPPLPTVAAAPRHAPRASSSQAPLHHSEQERPRAQDAFLAALIASPLALEALVPSRRLSSGKSGGRGGQGLQATLASYALLRALHALGVALRESIRERGATATAADDDDGETEKAKRSNSDGGGAWRAIAVKLMSSSMWLPSLSNAVLLHACVFHPSTFPRAYSSLIFRYSRPYLRLGAHHHQHRGAARPLPPGEIFETLAQTARARTPAPADAHALAAISSSRSREVLAEILQSQGSAITPARAPAYLTCAILHHAQEPSCTLQAIKYIAWATRQSLPFFGAFSLLGALVAYARAAARTRRKASQQGAGEVTSEKRTLNAWRLWRSALRSTALSSLTLAMALGTAWSSVCAIQRLLPSHWIPTQRFYISGFLAGLWFSLADLGSRGGTRARDLGLYTSRLALHTAWGVAREKGLVRDRKYGPAAVFTLATAVLMTINEVAPVHIHSSLTKLLLDVYAGKRAPPLAQTVSRRLQKLRR